MNAAKFCAQCGAQIMQKEAQASAANSGETCNTQQTRSGMYAETTSFKADAEQSNNKESAWSEVEQQQRKRIIESIAVYSVALLVILVGVILGVGLGAWVALAGIVLLLVCVSRYGILSTLRNVQWLKKMNKERVGVDIRLREKMPLYVSGNSAFFETKNKLLIPFQDVAWVYTYKVYLFLPIPIPGFVFMRAWANPRLKILTRDGRAFRVKENGSEFQALYQQNILKFPNDILFNKTKENKAKYAELKKQHR